MIGHRGVTGREAGNGITAFRDPEECFDLRVVSVRADEKAAEKEAFRGNEMQSTIPGRVISYAFSEKSYSFSCYKNLVLRCR